MNFAATINQVITLLLIMLVGFYARKKNYLNENVTKKLSELLLMVTNPLLVISSFHLDFTPELLRNIIMVFIFGIAAHTGAILLSQVLFMKYKDSTKKIMKFSAIYANCGFMGFPILQSLFGSTGILLGSVYTATFNIFVWTNGVMIFRSEKKLDRAAVKNAFLNPGIISVVVGLVLFLFSIKLPYPLTQTIDLVGNMTIPLSMIIVGANIAAFDLKKLFAGFELYYITAIRLLILPIIAYIILKLLGFSGILLSSCVLLVGMPIGTTTTIFAEMYNGDTAFASKVVAVSTLVSIITLPILMLLH